jgi:hypothetical protein
VNPTSDAGTGAIPEPPGSGKSGVFGARLGLWAGGFLLLLGGIVLRLHNLTNVLVRGHFYFVDADCYSRLSRVQLVLAQPGNPVRQQFFENWPEGVRSHATAPLDYLLAGFERILYWGWPRVGRLGALGDASLDLAGALISPLLGVGLGVLVWVWARGLELRDGSRPAWWWTAPLLVALSPPLVHASVFGRPDHQSLLVVLLSVALAAEERMLRRPAPGWAWAGGLCLGLALWVSLYEPLVLLGGVVVAGLVFWGASWRSRARLYWAVGLALPVALGVWVDGLQLVLPGTTSMELLKRWAGTIGELARIEELSVLSSWGSMLWACAPVGLCLEARRRGAGPAAWGWLLLLMLGTVLSVWQVRWTPYWCLLLALCSPLALANAGSSRIVLFTIVLAFAPVATEWRTRLFPDAQTRSNRHLDRSELINARRAAERMRSEEVQPFIAVWWLSPALAYWSGQPAVAGSGHEGIEGIVDSARFFTSTDPVVAKEILKARRVRYVVASDSARAVENACRVLGSEPPEGPLAERLWRPEPGPEWGLKGESNVVNFRLLRVLPEVGEGR